MKNCCRTRLAIMPLFRNAQARRYCTVVTSWPSCYKTACLWSEHALFSLLLVSLVSPRWLLYPVSPVCDVYTSQPVMFKNAGCNVRRLFLSRLVYTSFLRPLLCSLINELLFFFSVNLSIRISDSGVSQNNIGKIQDS